jgi:hypothetical protein
MKEFVIQALAQSKIAEAYIFAHLANPGLGMRAWQQYASQIIKGRKAKTGILVIQRVARTHICGIASYRTEIELTVGRILHVTHLAAIDMLDQGPVLSALLDRLTHLAQRSHCRSIRISLPETDRDRKHLYDALIKLRPRLVVRRRFGIDWNIHQPVDTFDLM